MGCSGSHGTVTVLENGSANGNDLQIPKDVRRVSDVPPLEGADIPSENIGNGTTTRPVTPRVLVRKFLYHLFHMRISIYLITFKFLEMV